MPERAIASVRRSVRLLLVGYFIMAIGIGFAFKAVVDLRRDSIRQVNDINVSQCDALNNLYTSIGKTLIESDKRINEIDYYKLHPAERLNAHKANEGIIRRFKRPPCPDKVRIPEGS